MLRDAAMGLFLGVPTGLAVGQVLLRKPKGKRSVWDTQYNNFILDAFDLIAILDRHKVQTAHEQHATAAWKLGCDVFRLIACATNLGDRAALRAYLLTDNTLNDFTDMLAPDTEQHEPAQKLILTRNETLPDVITLVTKLEDFCRCVQIKKEQTNPQNMLPHAARLIGITLRCMAYFLPLTISVQEAEFFQPLMKKDDPSTHLMWDAWAHYYYEVKET